MKSLKFLLERKALPPIDLLRHQGRVRPGQEVAPHIRLKNKHFLAHLLASWQPGEYTDALSEKLGCLGIG